MNNNFSDKILSLKDNINQKNKSIAIVGLGYVGLPLSLTFVEKGFSVFGIDIDKNIQ